MLGAVGGEIKRRIIKDGDQIAEALNAGLTVALWIVGIMIGESIIVHDESERPATVLARQSFSIPTSRVLRLIKALR